MKLSEAATLVFESAGVAQAIVQNTHSMTTQRLSKTETAETKTIITTAFRVLVWSTKGTFGEAESESLHTALIGAFDRAKVSHPDWLTHLKKSATKA